MVIVVLMRVSWIHLCVNLRSIDRSKFRSIVTGKHSMTYGRTDGQLLQKYQETYIAELG